jgi:hypothetical protein
VGVQHFTKTALDIESRKKPTVTINTLPKICPHCHSSQVPQDIEVLLDRARDRLEIISSCKNSDCYLSFSSFYFKNEDNSFYEFSHNSAGSFKKREFDIMVNEISQNFVKIYNEANKAENIGLMEIAGIGYRKAFEFLIKDYLISLAKDEDKNSIKKMSIAHCIQKIEYPKLNKIATLTIWLGNDEAHYLRRWESKDISDLKNLINISLHWIEMDINSDKYISDMSN